jgi:hypothetical protein
MAREKYIWGGKSSAVGLVKDISPSLHTTVDTGQNQLITKTYQQQRENHV